MKTFIFGMPPSGEVAHLPEKSAPIPPPLKTEISTEFEKHYPGAYILAIFDPREDIFALYHRSREVWVSRSDIKELVLTPTGPAKGPGYIEIGWQSETASWPTGIICSPTYSEKMHYWMRDRITKLGSLIDRPCRETIVYGDA